MNSSFLITTKLQMENRSLKREVKTFKNGSRYQKLQDGYRRICRGYKKEISRLRRSLEAANKKIEEVRNLWYAQSVADWEEYQEQLKKKDNLIQKLTNKIREVLAKYDEKIITIKRAHAEEVESLKAAIASLQEKIDHMEALMARDGTNTNLPTAQTPPGKPKHIPNSRRNTGKPKGGQSGHERHTLAVPDKSQITDTIDHPVKEGEVCPNCGSGDFTYTGEVEEKYEYDIQINVTRTLHKYWVARCNECGQEFRTGIDPNLRADCQYGPTIKALTLSLINTTNAAINKVPLLLSGLTKGEIHPSEGYVAKLQAKGAKGLQQFMKDLSEYLVTVPLLYWDDTVAFANKKRICIRFYGNERVSYYVAHGEKGLKGILEDGILEALTEMTKVMHDHNKVNYNRRFGFLNLECNAHLQRDLQKSADETGHTIMIEIKALISATMKDRKDLIENDIQEFDEDYIHRFEDRMTCLLELGKETAEANKSKYSGPFERAVIKRMIDYRECFFAWVYDFSLPTTNNLSERNLRGIKTKMKVAGQFASVETAEHFSSMKSYITTCQKNGINEIFALMRLTNGSPFSLAEVLSHTT